MPNKGLQVIWIGVHTKTGKRVRLLLPISVNVIRELLDCILDCMAVICLFAPKTPRADSHISAHTVKELTCMLLEFFGSITDDGPYNLVDVTAENVKVSVKIR